MQNRQERGAFVAGARCCAAALGLIACAALVACEGGSVAQQSAALTGCKLKRVRAKIKAQFTADGCTSPVGLCTSGKVWGLPGGCAKSYFTALNAAPSAGMPGSEPASTLSYVGELSISGKHGTLTLSDVGVFDQANLIFSEVQRVVGGSGKFAGATGTLYSYGEAPGGAGFEAKLVGELCLQ